MKERSKTPNELPEDFYRQEWLDELTQQMIDWINQASMEDTPASMSKPTILEPHR